jgi:hypothetical protein
MPVENKNKKKNRVKIFASINSQEEYGLVLNTIYSECKVVAVRRGS